MTKTDMWLLFIGYCVVLYPVKLLSGHVDGYFDSIAGALGVTVTYTVHHL